MSKEEAGEHRVEDGARCDDLAAADRPVGRRQQAHDGADDEDDGAGQPEPHGGPQIIVPTDAGKVPEPTARPEEEAEAVRAVDRRRVHGDQGANKRGEAVVSAEDDQEQGPDDDRR